MPELPTRVRAKVMALLDAGQRALTEMNMVQRSIAENENARTNTTDDAKAQAISREIARLQAMQPDNQARHRALADLNAKVSRYLEMLPADVELDDAKPIKAKLGEGETHLKVVQRMRGEIMALIGERSRAERSSPTTKEMKASAARFVQQLTVTPRLIIDHSKFELQFGRGTIGDPDPTPLQVLAWVDPTFVLKRLEAMIDAQPKPTNQMSAADRKKRLSELKEENAA